MHAYKGQGKHEKNPESCNVQAGEDGDLRICGTCINNSMDAFTKLRKNSLSNL
jgi:hypothetical protein